MEIGKINTLVASRPIEYGFILIDEEENEVLLPNAYLSKDIVLGEETDVFLYTDSEDRIVATILEPKVKLGEYAYLKAIDVNKFGAFMDWGLPKDLLVPFAEQASKMEEGKYYPIFLLQDESTGRLVGSSKINKFIIFDNIDLKVGQEVDILPYGMTDLGMNVIVDNKYRGLIFKSNIHKHIEEGEVIKAYVKKVREDGKLDIHLEPLGYRQSIDKNTQIILDALNNSEGFIALTDKSTPQAIKTVLGLSKKAFKRGVGNLYRQKIIIIDDHGIKLVK